MAEAVDIEGGARLERRRRPVGVEPAEEAAEPQQGVGVVELRPVAATAREEVLEITGQVRPPNGAPPRLSRFYTIVASGRASAEGPERRIKAVVRRDGRGGQITFRLLYWNDNYHPYRSENAADEIQPGATPR